jgi:hypothetical protein
MCQNVRQVLRSPAGFETNSWPSPIQELWERHALRDALRTAGLSSHLTVEERDFIQIDLSQASRNKADEFLWEIEAAACIAWALRLLPIL